MKVLIFLFCLSAASTTVSAGNYDYSNFEQFVSDGIFCEGHPPWSREKVALFKKMVKKANFRMVTFKKAEYDGFVGNEYFLLREKGLTRVFEYEVLAVFREMKGFHFLALLNASKEDITKVVKQGLKTRNNPYELLNYYEGKEYFDYSPIAKNADDEQKSIRLTSKFPIRHRGKHMDGFGWENSNRTIFSLVGVNYPPKGIEIESCEETHSKWYKNICKKFNKKPLTWVGCANIHSEHYDLNVTIERVPFN